MTIWFLQPSSNARKCHVTFDANGNLIEVGDGGVTRRTSADDNTGDWFSINGDIQVAEAHSVAYDTNFDISTAGTQDTGAVEQTGTGSPTWDSVTSGDGGKVAVDDAALGISVRYFSSQRLADFMRRTCNPACVDAFPALAGGVPPLVTGQGGNAQFYTPIELNTADPVRLLIGALDDVYESPDQGDTVAAVPAAGGVSVRANSHATMVYGHPNNDERIYVGAGVQVFVRTTAAGDLTPTATAFPGGTVYGIAVDPADEDVAYVIGDDRVYQTLDGGATWTEITGNIAAGGAGTFRAIAYIEGPAGSDKLVVGSNAGVMVSGEPYWQFWFELVDELPNGPVRDLDYDVADDLMVAGILGRGVWTLTDVSLISVPVVSYKWYFMKQRALDAPRLPIPIAEDVRLNDQFVSNTMDVFALQGLWNPAAKNEAVNPDRDDHYDCYSLSGLAVTPAPRVVEIETLNFGIDTVTLSGASKLCVPSIKRFPRGGEPEGDIKGTNYRCYRATDSDFVPPESITLDDQFFDSRQHDLTRLSHLCAPVGVNAPEPPSDPALFDHFACYQLATTPRFFFDVEVEDPLMQQVVPPLSLPVEATVESEKGFCEPARKLTQ